MAVCTKVNTLVFASGEVLSALECEGVLPIHVPYRAENNSLVGWDLHTQQCAAYRSWMSPVQICPECGSFLHLSPAASRCYNIHCTQYREHIFFHQLALLGISPCSELMTILRQRRIANPCYDLIDLAREIPTLGFAYLTDLPLVLNVLGTSVFLKLLKMDSTYDGPIDQLDLKYPFAANLIKAVYCGDLITLAATTEIRDADALRATAMATTVNTDFCQKYLAFVS